ncbi:hypothetical protein TA3x_001423 [Tundrisphaera sp. TA3]|uniref:hypothetical protein n=1 Tax=Tundrisphaera sp. TA3 TaxID=3435775 RepID=UPI003EB96C1D
MKCGPVGAAGHFQINRAGNVSEIFCISLDYRIFVRQGSHPTAIFVMDSFRNHHALELSPLAIFRFKRDTYGTYFLSLDGEPIADPAGRQELLVREGEGPAVERPFTDEERRAFAGYRPSPPPQRYAMHLDQQVLNLESDDAEGFEIGPGVPPYSPDSPALTSGRKAFVIDREGWVIIGNGHHILSGGNEVGAAGQIIVEPSGVIGQINLNFSGHYRPPLDATYARYTYRVLASHPLLTLAPDCIITGRKFDDLDVHSSNLKFSAEELLSDDPELDELIEYAML